jgi:hypothetical protein
MEGSDPSAWLDLRGGEETWQARKSSALPRVPQRCEQGTEYGTAIFELENRFMKGGDQIKRSETKLWHPRRGPERCVACRL